MKTYRMSMQYHQYVDLFQEFKKTTLGDKLFVTGCTGNGEAEMLSSIVGNRLQPIPGLFGTPAIEPKNHEASLQNFAIDNDSDGDSSHGYSVTTKPSSNACETTMPIVQISVVTEDEIKPPPTQKRSSVSGMRRCLSGLSVKQDRLSSRDLVDTNTTQLGFDHSDYLNVKRYHPRPCHRFYLTNGCRNGGKCHYAHEHHVSRFSSANATI